MGVAAALIGFIGGWFMSDKSGGRHGQAAHSYGSALIDDYMLPPEHARFSWMGLLKVVVIGSLLWTLPMAVLPYVHQGAVSHYEWLTPIQMIDGFALGETTPGTLIMMVSFVGFVGGYVKAVHH